MKISRRDTMQLSATALAGLVALGAADVRARRPAAPPPKASSRPVAQHLPLPLKPDGSLPDNTAGGRTITGVLWRTKNQTPTSSSTTAR